MAPSMSVFRSLLVFLGVLTTVIWPLKMFKPVVHIFLSSLFSVYVV